MDISPIAICLRIANSPSQLASNPLCTLWKTGNLAHTTTTEEEKTRVVSPKTPNRSLAAMRLRPLSQATMTDPLPRGACYLGSASLPSRGFRHSARTCLTRHVPRPKIASRRHLYLSTNFSHWALQPRQTQSARSRAPVPPLSDGDLTMEAYLDLCHIQPGDTQTHAAIERHSLYHWLIFKTTSIQRLCKLGIRYGPAVLLKGGVHKAMKRLHQD
ncbi:hypothetical protein PTTG_26770 [Puccinia triticina 1-1 BBBD Race 1]|uniref:Uncharacterized protein n=1 Tax=Puccinia triticina (isolate 1-1 / race 1 (BBBD)) TaxID=630390 RepID=A0A180GQN9_PUCT1|nr:hypothetical protein PTTG_26770 [Puccinia triticina 1-1 BBBD Race 1]